MKTLNDLDEQEQAELQAWLRNVSNNAELIERLQGDLVQSPEFIALMVAYRGSTGRLADEALKDVANFTVLYLTSRKA